MDYSLLVGIHDVDRAEQEEMELGRAEQGPGGSPAAEEKVGGRRAWQSRTVGEGN